MFNAVKHPDPAYLCTWGSLLRGAASIALDAGGKRSDIAEKTGVVVGVANASLSVERGAISVFMGLSGSGKSTLLRAANGLNSSRAGRYWSCAVTPPTSAVASSTSSSSWSCSWTSRSRRSIP